MSPDGQREAEEWNEEHERLVLYGWEDLDARTRVLFATMEDVDHQSRRAAQSRTLSTRTELLVLRGLLCGLVRSYCCR